MHTELTGRAAVDRHLQQAEDKLARLRSLDPVFFDISLREPCFASPIGHTLQNKLDLLKLVDRFGVQNRIIATLDYQYGDHPEVEDDFCLHLQKEGYDLRHSFAMTSLGGQQGGVFVPDLSMQKLVDYGIPNTILEVEPVPGADLRMTLANIAGSIAWLREHLAPVDGQAGRVYLNVLNLIDVFMADRAGACEIVALVATLPFDGLSFEDDRGTYFPFQVGAIAAAAKAMLRADQQLLCHVHTNNGMENASVIEALLQGADGYWGGLERTSSTIGHASLGELIANLVRAGNPHVTRYAVDQLAPICDAMHAINTGEAMPQEWPVFGANAYRSVLSDFDQRSNRPMDLAPDAIGRQYVHRIAPVGSDVPVVQARVQEALDLAITEPVAKRMILLMREDLRNNLRIEYDQPAQLQQLVDRALLPR
ncbi:isopropylmalate/homocitrate/citramalate synthase [Pseudoduganella lurida]|uniref:Isopropylmalate/homocitrate/citramalate synthase n=1 Tax=Pseudoduganella lurida TaxID=1036180 RepID=A0A562RLT9_9BURK|nr:homocitrate synthase [Pseudoduganella lurida]TWI70015.1 isopropylmalate/homocitrate/citramalate synthase [Pseudoduganella lurida]